MNRDRPVIGIDVDGVIAVEPPPRTAVSELRVSAWGRWTRTILVPEHARATLETLAKHADIVWVSAWGHTAPAILSDALDLPHGASGQDFIPCQFAKATALASYADGRPWALIHDGLDKASALVDGLVIVVDPHVGIAAVDVDKLVVQLERMSVSRAPSPKGFR